jgi:hypothetical protein
VSAPTTLADWAALARIANALGADTPADLPRIRAALAATNPAFAKALTTNLPPRGQLLEPAGVA